MFAHWEAIFVYLPYAGPASKIERFYLSKLILLKTSADNSCYINCEHSALLRNLPSFGAYSWWAYLAAGLPSLALIICWSGMVPSYEWVDAVSCNLDINRGQICCSSNSTLMCTLYICCNSGAGTEFPDILQHVNCETYYAENYFDYWPTWKWEVVLQV